MSKHHLAQVNIAKRLADFSDPVMQGFVNNVNKMNAIADTSDGFIWRLKDEDKDPAVRVFKDDMLIINMSVWENREALFNYTYHSGHIEVLKRKKDWFSKINSMHMAFWYIPEGYIPTFQDAKERLDYLNKYGETPYAFTFKSKFSAKEALQFKLIK